MKAVAWTIVVLIATGVLGAAIIVYSGAYNVAATQAHSAPVHWLLSAAQRQSVSARADAYQAPGLDGEEMRAAGASAPAPTPASAANAKIPPHGPTDVKITPHPLMRAAAGHHRAQQAETAPMRPLRATG